MAKVVTKLVSCENSIIKREFFAVSFACVEKKNDKTTILIGPPPIPRNDELTPRIKPMITQTSLLVICFVLIPDFFTRYKNTRRFISNNNIDCISFTLAVALPEIIAKTVLPSHPPTQAPKASHSVVA